MKNIIILFIVGVLAWKGYEKYQNHSATLASEQQKASVITEVNNKSGVVTSLPSTGYRCDGTH